MLLKFLISYRSDFRRDQNYPPKWTKRCKGQPSLEYQSNDASPVENQTHFELHHHVVVANVEYNEWERVEQCEQKESVGYPSMEDLQLFVRNASQQCDPVCFTSSRTAESQSINNRCWP